MTKIFKTIEKLEILHHLIKDEKTGTPDDLAKRLDISRGTLYKFIETLKSQNIGITYSRTKESFKYTDNIDLEIQFSIKVIRNEEELMKIDGGSSLFSFRSRFYTEGL